MGLWLIACYFFIFPTSLIPNACMIVWGSFPSSFRCHGPRLPPACQLFPIVRPHLVLEAYPYHSGIPIILRCAVVLGTSLRLGDVPFPDLFTSFMTKKMEQSGRWKEKCKITANKSLFGFAESCLLLSEWTLD